MGIEKSDGSRIQGILFGHAEDKAGATGCSVVLCPQGAVAGVDVRGGAPGTRETELLNPVNLIERIHGVVLAGGSAFGLAAADGVMQYLEEHGYGFDTGAGRVPIVPGAVLFDLPVGNQKVRPDREMGYRACQNARQGWPEEGTVGAGTGATVGKWRGYPLAMKGGLGFACFRRGELEVGALMAVNTLGDVCDPDTGEILAGALTQDKSSFADSEELIAAASEQGKDPFAGNTTIGVILTNGRLTKAQATKVAAMGQDGMARVLRPAHTMYDGDTLFAMSTGQVAADVTVAGFLAARAVSEAIRRGIENATSLAGVISRQDWLAGKK